MTKEEAKQRIRTDWRVILPKLTERAKEDANGEPSYVCPNPVGGSPCNHGKTEGAGLTFDPSSKDGNTLKCFKCGFSGDIIQLYRNMKGVDFVTACEDLARLDGLQIDEKAPTRDFMQKTGNYTTLEGKRATARQKRGERYYQACAEALAVSPEALAYIQGRGISQTTAEKFGLGYDPEWQSPTALLKGKNPPKSRRIIIPTCPAHYVARCIDPPKTSTEKQFAKMNEGEAELFNLKALYEGEPTDPVFIVEGAFDALSIEEVGADAVALNSTSNARKLLEYLKTKPTKKTLILALDNDGGGATGKAELIEGLNEQNVPYIVANIAGEYKDANEALQADRAEFDRLVLEAKTRTSVKPNTLGAYIDTRMAEDMANFKANCKVSTGFENLDEVSGGLFQGLYVLAGTTSLGKTTFALQLADNLATAGRDVIYFSLEQSAFEVVTKAITRQMYKAGRKVLSINLRCGELPKGYPDQLEAYKNAVGDKLSVIEGNFSCDVAYIENYTKNYIRRTGAHPVVFIDYLQILQPEDERQTVRDNIDKTTTALKRLSRNLGLTVFVISSVNRANYLTPIDFESLKESGGIEYTADVIWGLQLEVLNTEDYKNITDKNGGTVKKREMYKQAKGADPREIELVCLKNRHGKASYSCFFKYFPAWEYFEESY